MTRYCKPALTAWSALLLSAVCAQEDLFAGLEDPCPADFASVPLVPPPPATPPVASTEPADAPPVAAPALLAVPPPPVFVPPAAPLPGSSAVPSPLALSAPPVRPSPPADCETSLARGRAAFAAGRLSDARAHFENALRCDPYNREAADQLQQTVKKTARREANCFDTTRERLLESVQAAWNTPKSAAQLPAAPQNPAPQPVETQREGVLREKAAAIRIPEVSFSETSLQEAVRQLSDLGRRLDPAGQGVNLTVCGTADRTIPPVTFSGTGLSLLEMLDILAGLCGLKYEAGPCTINLMPVDYEPPQEMVSREFDLLPAVASKLCSGESPEGIRDARPFFSTVPFPSGSAAQFHPEFNVLLVRNAPKHMDSIAALLARYTAKALAERARQVEIETKFLEVSQGSLEELGFDWTLGTPGENISSGTWTLPGGQKLFSDSLRSSGEALNPGIATAGRAAAFNRYAAATADPTGSGLAGTAGELLIQKVKGDLPVDLVIRALERSAGADLLSAPKLLARSGETASIHVGEIRWFPSAYDVTVERYAQPSLVPLDYEEQKTGVMLEVTPELDPENRIIHLKLTPEIRELAGFDEQHVSTIWPEYGDESLDLNSDTPASTRLIDFLTLREESRTINADRLIARRPVFKTRRVSTAVTLEDGSTIAMGGLIKEQLETFRDSVPVLGRIPLLGRLFRSEGERSTKRNLLIFVTASQVDATGSKRSTGPAGS